MNYLTLGIIGHVDHGKTALVKALSGVDTDRLKEEKERGISIALGYAHIELPGGQIGLIDVPGHEKFIRTMIAGATGIESVLLVVDVNEGIKPQTIEHLEIAELLGVGRGVVAVTKCDAAQPGRVEDVTEEIEILVHETFLESAPVIFTSSVTEEGFDDLREVLGGLLTESAPLPDEGAFYMPIDRVFSMAGFGTVLTGTLRRGVVRVGDDFEIYPHGIKGKIRELQSHNAFTEESEPGHRTAINLRGVEKGNVRRGDVIATPGTLLVAKILDVEMRLLRSADAPLKNHQQVRVLFGATEAFARTHLIDRDELAPGDACLLQLRLEEPVAALSFEPFIIRTYSPMRTIGGGKILRSSTKGHRRFDEEGMKHMRVFAEAKPEAIVMAELEQAGERGASLDHLYTVARLSKERGEALVASLPVVSIGSDTLLTKKVYEDVEKKILQALASFHDSSPTLLGMPKPQVGQLADLKVHPAVLEQVLEGLVSQKRIIIEEGVLRLSKFSPAGAMSESELAVVGEIETAFEEKGLEPPSVDAVLHGDKDRNRLYKYLLDKKKLVATFPAKKPRTPGNAVVFHALAMDRGKELLLEHFGDRGAFTTSEAKGVLEISRKYLIPFLEYLDTIGFTRRTPDERVLLGGQKK